MTPLIPVIFAASLCLAVPAISPNGEGTGVDCKGAGCRAVAGSEGSTGTTPAPAATTPTTSGAANSDSGSSASDPCPWSVVETLGANSSWWGGNDPSAGHIELNKCVVGDLKTPGGAILQIRFVPNGGPAGPAAPPPPTPEQLAQRAIAQLVVPAPTVGVGPDRAKLAVNLWTWLWVDDAPPVSVTAAAGTVSVTATATLTSTTWSLGEPAAGDAYVPGAPTPLTCQGAGVPPPAVYDWRAEPPCGHKFAWRSLKERTGGSGKWPVTGDDQLDRLVAVQHWRFGCQCLDRDHGRPVGRRGIPDGLGTGVRRLTSGEPLVPPNRSCCRTPRAVEPESE